jgi:membrane protease YdiL (CAAX protease family)
VPTVIAVVAWQRWTANDPALFDLFLILAGLGSIAVVAFAARMAGGSIPGYLGLTFPRGYELMLGLASPIIFLATYFGVAKLTGLWVGGTPTARFELIFLLSTIVVAPLSEELVYRGFLYRGLAQSLFGPCGAVLLISAVFALGHDGGLIKHFCSGLLYGWLRWFTASTTVPIVGHATNNLAVLVLEAGGVGWASY